MLTTEQIEQQLAVYQQVGEDRYAPLVGSSTAAAELFLFFAMLKLRAAAANGLTPPEKIPFRFAIELNTTAVIGLGKSDPADQVDRFVNSMRTAVYRIRNRSLGDIRHMTRRFKITYNGYELHSGAIDERPLVHCALISLNYIDNAAYNSIARSDLLRNALAL